MSDPVRLIYSRPALHISKNDESHTPSPPVRRWKVVRREDHLVLGRYACKPKACSAATRFGADGCTYDVIEDVAVSAPDRSREHAHAHARHASTESATGEGDSTAHN